MLEWFPSMIIYRYMSSKEIRLIYTSNAEADFFKSVTDLG